MANALGSFAVGVSALLALMATLATLPQVCAERPELRQHALHRTALAVTPKTAAFVQLKESLDKEASRRGESTAANDGESVTFTNESATLTDMVNHLYYSYKIDPSDPLFVRKAEKIFQTVEPDVVARHTMKASTLEVGTVQDTANELATQTSIEGSYNAFSGAASVDTKRMAKSHKEQWRADKTITTTSKRITQVGRNLFDNLRSDYNDLWWKEPKEIVDTLGEFYAHRIDFGGMFKSTFVKQKSSRKSQQEVQAEMTAKYEGLCASAAAKQGIQTNSENAMESSDISARVTAFGGNTNLWLGLNGHNMDAIQEQWSQTVNDENSFPIAFQLKPIWTLLEVGYPEYAKSLKTYLLDKWEQERNDELAKQQADALFVRPSDPLTISYNSTYGLAYPRETNNKWPFAWIGPRKQTFFIKKWSDDESDEIIKNGDLVRIRVLDSILPSSSKGYNNLYIADNGNCYYDWIRMHEEKQKWEIWNSPSIGEPIKKGDRVEFKNMHSGKWLTLWESGAQMWAVGGSTQQRWEIEGVR